MAAPTQQITRPEPHRPPERFTPARPAAEAALRALYAHHSPMLLAYAEGFARDRRAAQIVVQDTFRHAWHDLPQLLGDERRTRTWLLDVARNLLTTRVAAPRGGTPYEESRVS